jgi:hypothetical protein
LPAPDAIGTIAMSATAGKVALVTSTKALIGSAPVNSAIVDLVGYGIGTNSFRRSWTGADPEQHSLGGGDGLWCAELGEVVSERAKGDPVQVGKFGVSQAAAAETDEDGIPA